MVVLQLNSKNALLERPQPKHIQSDWPQICRKQSEISLNWPKSHMQLYFTLCFCIFVPFCGWYFFEWMRLCYSVLCFMSTGLTVPYTETDTLISICYTHIIPFKMSSLKFATLHQISSQTDWKGVSILPRNDWFPKVITDSLMGNRKSRIIIISYWPFKKKKKRKKKLKETNTTRR